MYSFTIDVPAPIEMYDGLHAALIDAVSNSVPGMLLHLGRTTETGFQVTEIWESKEQCDFFMATVLVPIGTELAGGAAPPPLPVQDFDLRGLIIPSADLWV